MSDIDGSYSCESITIYTIHSMHRMVKIIIYAIRCEQNRILYFVVVLFMLRAYKYSFRDQKHSMTSLFIQFTVQLFKW